MGMTQGDLAKAYEGHNKQITEERHKASEAASKMEVERKEMQRINDERMKELVTELEDLKADHKRLENDKIMSAKVSFAYVIGLFYLCIRSLLTLMHMPGPRDRARPPQVAHRQPRKAAQGR